MCFSLPRPTPPPHECYYVVVDSLNPRPASHYLPVPTISSRLVFSVFSLPSETAPLALPDRIMFNKKPCSTPKSILCLRSARGPKKPGRLPNRTAPLPEIIFGTRRCALTDRTESVPGRGDMTQEFWHPSSLLQHLWKRHGSAPAVLRPMSQVLATCRRVSCALNASCLEVG